MILPSSQALSYLHSLESIICLATLILLKSINCYNFIPLASAPFALSHHPWTALFFWILPCSSRLHVDHSDYHSGLSSSAIHYQVGSTTTLKLPFVSVTTSHHQVLLSSEHLSISDIPVLHTVKALSFNVFSFMPLCVFFNIKSMSFSFT